MFRSCLLAAIAIGLLASVCGAAEFYVATNGNDRWSGRFPEPNADRSDGPLASLAAARDAVRRPGQRPARPRNRLR